MKSWSPWSDDPGLPLRVLVQLWISSFRLCSLGGRLSLLGTQLRCLEGLRTAPVLAVAAPLRSKVPAPRDVGPRRSCTGALGRDGYKSREPELSSEFLSLPSWSAL